MTSALTQTDNEILVMQILEEFKKCNVTDIVLCPGGRNTPFVMALEKCQSFKLYYWSEERSAAFFALGRSKLTKQPVVVCTTSGTAAGELLPAAMEAFYTQIPLILLTADRPRTFRGTGAPQTAEQVGLFGQYAVFSQDLAANERCNLQSWKQNGAAHLNVCLEEPLVHAFENISLDIKNRYSCLVQENPAAAEIAIDQFIQKCHFPLVVVSAISKEAKESVVKFLLQYQAPIYLEGVSGLREDERLAHLRITRTDHLWKDAKKANYPIDGVLRIGAVPTFRLWRDLEDKKGEVAVCSLSELPFSGLSWGIVHCVSLKSFFQNFYADVKVNKNCSPWIYNDRQYQQKLLNLFDQFPRSEAALVYKLSKQIPTNSQVYLGNSLPIREWDAYAAAQGRDLNVSANRGLNGIDGQLSTFFGMCSNEKQNWGIFGDLTTIYDLAAPWILEQMRDIELNLIIINNGGGKIFSRMFPLKQIQNPHSIGFKSLAELWNIRYEKYSEIPERLPFGGHQLIEIIPDEQETVHFWNAIGNI